MIGGEVRTPSNDIHVLVGRQIRGFDVEWNEKKIDEHSMIFYTTGGG